MTYSRKHCVFFPLLAVIAAPLWRAGADVQSISAVAETSLREFVDGAVVRTAGESLAHPAAALPLQATAHLVGVSAAGSTQGAGAIGAQVADPLLGQNNPEDFAINLSLASKSDAVRYEGTAIAQETRGLLFVSGELGAGAINGTQHNLTGRFTIDGALALLAEDGGADISGASLRLSVSVERVAGQSRQTVFSGFVQLDGASDGGATVASGGDFPVQALVLSALSGESADLGVFQVLIIPSVGINYAFDAAVGEAFDLVATVRVDAVSIGGRTGVSGVIGTPTSAIQEVIALTDGASTADAVLSALARERENPSGDVAFPTAQPAGLCGLLGLEFLLGLVGLAAWRGRAARLVLRR